MAYSFLPNRHSNKRWTIKVYAIPGGLACHTCNKQGRWKWTRDKLYTQVIQTLSMSHNAKHSDTVLLLLLFSNCPDGSKYADVLPDITQTTLCHILWSCLVPWKQSLHCADNSIKTEPRAGTLTSSLSSRKCLCDVTQKWNRKIYLRRARLSPSDRARGSPGRCGPTDPHSNNEGVSQLTQPPQPGWKTRAFSRCAQHFRPLSLGLCSLLFSAMPFLIPTQPFLSLPAPQLPPTHESDLLFSSPHLISIQILPRISSNTCSLQKACYPDTKFSWYSLLPFGSHLAFSTFWCHFLCIDYHLPQIAL